MRWLLALALTNLLLTLAGLGWLAWVVADPQRWFPSAYAEKGATGDRGPDGPRGPAGPPGPVGPDAEAAISDLSFRLDDLETTLSADDLQTQVDDLQFAIEDLCDAISLNYIYASNSAIEELLTDLNGACP